MHTVLSCGRLLRMSHVAWSVCMYVCLSVSVLGASVSPAKRTNRSRCLSRRADFYGPEKPRIKESLQPPYWTELNWTELPFRWVQFSAVRRLWTRLLMWVTLAPFWQIRSINLCDAASRYHYWSNCYNAIMKFLTVLQEGDRSSIEYMCISLFVWILQFLTGITSYRQFACVFGEVTGKNLLYHLLTLIASDILCHHLLTYLLANCYV